MIKQEEWFRLCSDLFLSMRGNLRKVIWTPAECHAVVRCLWVRVEGSSFVFVLFIWTVSTERLLYNPRSTGHPLSTMKRDWVRVHTPHTMSLTAQRTQQQTILKESKVINTRSDTSFSLLPFDLFILSASQPQVFIVFLNQSQLSCST